MKSKLPIFLLFILTSHLLNAHPHIFIDYKIDLLNSNKVLVEWKFDPLESEKNLYYFDQNKDGNLSDDESAVLYDEAFKNIKNYGYFLFIKVGNNQFKIDKIENFNVVVNEDGTLTYKFNFDLPDFGEEILTITHFDTSYFVAFGDPGEEAIVTDKSIYKKVRKNRNVPYYYDPAAGTDIVLDTSNPKPGWIKVYPTEVLISRNPIKIEEGFKGFFIKEKIVELQKSIYLLLSDYIIDLTSGSRESITLLILISLLYGIIHALGPGHRKIIISSYLLSKENSSYREGIAISQLSAFIHSISGIAVVFILYFILNKVVDTSLLVNNSMINNLTSITLITLAALLIFNKLKPVNSNKGKKNRRMGELSLIYITSLLPCPGAATVMLVSISLNITIYGILSVLFISIGIGTTLSLISILSLKAKKIVELKSENKFKIIKQIIEWIAIGVILLFAISLFSIQG